MRQISIFCAACAVAWLLAPPAVAADATREVHGSADAFATPGLALAWAVLRAPKEGDTAVVIRIEPDAQAFAWIEVVGKDPFTQSERPFLAATSVGGPFDLKVPRATFADFPRTEIRLWRSGAAPAAAPAAAPPALLVYYLGVPDTTPEVTQPADLDRSLSSRIARARDPERKAP
jgi:hypothetical protein